MAKWATNDARAQKAMESAGSSGGGGGPIRAAAVERVTVVPAPWGALGRCRYCICYSVLVVAAMHALHHAISY